MTCQVASTPGNHPLLRKIIRFLRIGVNVGSKKPSPKKSKYSQYHLSPHLRRDLGIEPFEYIRRRC